MGIMQVGGNRGHSKSARLRDIGNIIDVSDQNWFAIVRHIGGTWTETVKSVELLEWQIRTDEYGSDLLHCLVKLLRREYSQSLVRLRAPLSGGGVGGHRRGRCQARNRLMDRHDGHLRNK